MVVIDRAAIFDIYHTDQLINTRTVDEFLGKAARVVVFSDNITAIVDISSRIAIDCLFDTPAGLQDKYYWFE